MATKVIMPQLGESVVEGTVTKWLHQEGDTIQEFDSLLEVNTDKVDTEIPSPAEGTLLKILIPEGTTVTAGTIIAWIGKPDEVVPDASNGKTAPPEAKTAQLSQPAAAPEAGRDQDLGFISPVVAKLAQENQIDLHQVTGTGLNNRITKKDVLAYLEQRNTAAVSASAEIPAWETPADGDLFRPTELVFGTTTAEPPQLARQSTSPTTAPATIPPGDTLVPMTTVRKAIADHMVFSKHTSPHVSTIMEADMSQVIAHRTANKTRFANDGAKLTFTPYFIAASIAALKTYPLVNASWSDQGIVIHRAINIGMATSLGDEGLIVPVIKGSDGLSLLGLTRAVNDLAERARTHRLQPDEVKGGTFTITNHGISGSLFATPIINQPQCAILGVGAIQKRVVVINDAIAIRPMVYLSLTFDHRILDGAIADHFLAKIVEALQNWV